MKLDATPAGLEAQLQIAGTDRFFSAGFLAVWLAGWAAGEAFALWMLVVGVLSLLTGQPPEAGRELDNLSRRVCRGKKLDPA